MTPLHLDAFEAQSSHTAGSPCGDVIRIERGPAATLVVVADGLGHGAKAHVAATLHASRLMELCRRGRPLRAAFEALVETQEKARRSDLPFAALTVARVRHDGETCVLTYESPAALLVGPRTATLLPGSSSPVGGGLVSEAYCVMEPGDTLLLVSDGVTQAGLGCGMTLACLSHQHSTAAAADRAASGAARSPLLRRDPATPPHRLGRNTSNRHKHRPPRDEPGEKRRLGWTSEGLHLALTRWLAEGVGPEDIAGRVHAEARRLWGRVAGDDCTALALVARPARQVNVLTGPPLSRDDDAPLVRRFLAASGMHVVCGASTAKMVARVLRRELEVEQAGASSIAPPQYRIEGIDLVTEGAVTLNQAFNVLDADPGSLEPGTGVTALVDALSEADRVHFHVGRAPNMGGDDIAFRQLGVLPRQTIVPLLQQRLVDRSKLVTVEWN